MSTTTEEVLKGFEVRIYDNENDWIYKGGVKPYKSPKALLEALSAKRQETVFLEIELECFKSMNTINGRIELVSEATLLFMDERVKKLSSRTNLIIYHYANFKKETAIQLGELANTLIRKGVKFGRLSFIYKNGSSMIEEEYQALTENIEIYSIQYALPPLRLLFYKEEGESKGLDILCRFLALQWPMKYFKITRESFASSDFDWKDLKRVIAKSGQHFKVDLVSTSGQKNFVPILESFSSNQKCIYLTGFENKAECVAKFFDPTSDRWMNGAAGERTLKIGYFKFSLFYEDNTCYVKLEEDQETFLERLTQMFRERKMMLVENISIFINEEKKSLIDELLNSIISNNSLINLSIILKDGESKRDMTIPAKLTNEIKARKDRKEAEFPSKVERWIKSGSSIKYSRMKLMLIGNKQAGKSSTMRSILGERFDEELPSTFVANSGNDISMKLDDVSIKAWKKCNLRSHWLSEEFTDQMNRVKHGVVDVIDNSTQAPVQTNPQKNKLQRTIPHSKTNLKAKTTGIFGQVVTGFKPSRAFKSKSLEPGRAQMSNEQSKNIQTVEFSSEEISKVVLSLLKDSRNAKDSFTKDIARLAIWDIGGREVFDGLHHLYMSPGCLYLLVMNLKEMRADLDSELKTIRYWLESVSFHTPDSGVIVVGTRCDEVSDGDCKTIDLAFLNLVRRIKVNIVSAEKFCFFPLDNSNSETIEEMTKPLREMILECFKGDIKFIENVWKKHIPIAWMYLMSFLSRNFKGIISSNKVVQLASQLNLNKPDVVSMLQFYENAGAILPFLKSETAKEVTLGDFIVLQPDWLLKAYGNFIYEPDLHGQNKKMTTSALVEYEESGILSRRLLAKVLGQSRYSEESIQLIVQLSKKLLLMSDFAFKPEWGSDDDDEFLIVPSMIRQKATKRINKRSSISNCYNFYISFKNYVPIGVYERIFCLLLSMNNAFDGFSTKPSVYKDLARLYFREFPVFFVNESEKGRIRISLPKKRFVDEPNAILNIIKVVEQVISSFKSDALGKSFNPDLLFEGVIEDDGDDVIVHCFWNDLLSATSKGEDIVSCVAEDGEEESESLKVFHPFDLVANLAVEEQIPEAEVIKEKEEGETIPWEYDALFTHTWGPNNESHLQVIEIKKQLEERGLRIWVDDANLSNYVPGEAVAAIEKSSTILVFITKLYLEKINDCHTNVARELQMAAQVQPNTLIPIVLEEELLDQKTWLGFAAAFHLTSSVIYDFSNPEAVVGNFEKLIETIKISGERPRIPIYLDTVVI